jgi:DNA-binding CsgD family transcriptional regulator
MVRCTHMHAKLAGSASWLAIVGAMFFWSWLDQCMFGPALFSPVDRRLADISLVVMGLASVAGMGLAAWVAHWSKVASGDPAAEASGAGGSSGNDPEPSGLWCPRFAVGSACMGVLSCVVCGTSLNADGMGISYVLGIALAGLSMGALQVVWGIVALAQGVERALLHLSGAWALGLIANLAFQVVPGFGGWYAASVLPALSIAIYVVLFALQKRPRLRIEAPASANASAAGVTAKPDLLFVAIVFAVCTLFGMMTLLHPMGGFAENLVSSGMDSVFARCVTSAFVFAACLALPRNRVTLVFNVTLSFVALGALALTVSLFDIAWQFPGRLLVAVGYMGLDLLIWAVMACLCETRAMSPAKTVFMVISAQQAGIVLGGAFSAMAYAVNVGAEALSVLLVVLNYGLLVACYVLLRRYVGWVGGCGMDSISPSVGTPKIGSPSQQQGREDAILAYAQLRHLTAREIDVLLLLAEGRNVPYIAERFVVSENTVKSHVRHIYEKCDFHDRQELLDALEDIR